MQIERTRVYIKDGLLYSSSLMILIILYSNAFNSVYIKNIAMSLIEFLIFGIAICITHYISDKISLYLTSFIIKNAIESKKKLPKTALLLPWIFQVISDVILVIIFCAISVQVVFYSFDEIIFIAIILRFINLIIELVINIFRRIEISGESRN